MLTSMSTFYQRELIDDYQPYTLVLNHSRHCLHTFLCCVVTLQT